MLFVPTRDRAPALAMALRSHRAALQRRGVSLPIVVIDDSTSEAPNAAACAETNSVHFGRADRTFLARGLARTADEREALAFALIPPAVRTATWVGATRNAAALLGAGGTFASIDDDSTSHFWEPKARWIAKRASDPEPTDLVDPSDLATVASDPWSPHAALLGRRVDTHVDPTAPPALRIAMTFLGVFGDLGLGSPGQLAFLTGASRARLAGGLLHHVLAGGRAARLARTTQPSLFPFGMMGAFGADASAMLPPCFPVGRNEDGLFTLLLRVIDPHACLVHLPLAVAHRLHDVRRVSWSSFAVVAATPRITDLARLVAARGFAACEAGAPATRLSSIARAFGADLPTLTELTHLWNVQRDRYANQLVDNARECPRGDLHDAMQAMAAALRVPASIEERVDGMPVLETLARYGRLLHVWPEVWSRAARERRGLEATMSCARRVVSRPASCGA